jgi:hypothetical protein
MVSGIRTLLMTALTAAMIAVLSASAAAQMPSADSPEGGVEPEFLKSLPHPPDQPRSLLLPASPVVHFVPDLEGPYFQEDPLLDPPQWGQTGWFWDVQTSIVKPHIQNEMQEFVTTGLGTTVFVEPGNTPVSWTAAPRFELGYRLPAGFGAFSIADTAFNTNGSDTVLLPDGPASRTSTLQMNRTDLDYISREFTPCPGWDLRWRAGMRVAESFTMTTINQPLAQAAAGSGVVTQQASNATLGVGPHFAFEVDRSLGNGFSLVGKVDLGDNYTMIRQRYSVSLSTFAAPGAPDSGVTIDRFQNQIIFLTTQIGLAWQPPRYPCSRVFAGYLQETWWNVMTNGNGLAAGQFDFQGLTLRASWNY